MCKGKILTAGRPTASYGPKMLHGWMARFAGAVVALILPGVIEAAQPTEHADGEWRLRLAEHGLEVFHGDRQLTIGSYFTVFDPGYTGSIISYGAFWDHAVITRTSTGIRAQAQLQNAAVTYEVAIEGDAVSTVLQLAVAEEADPGPTEYARLQLAPAVIKGTTVEMLDPAGVVVDTKAVPDIGVRGGMAASGEVMRIRTAGTTYEITASGGTSIYPFDARVDRYGRSQGLWVFSGIPLSPGHATILSTTLRALPPEKPRPPGNVVFAGGATLSRILLADDATDRERFAAGELAAYIRAICGKEVPVEETASAAAGPGTVAVGKLACRTGQITEDELAPVERDGFVVRADDSRAALCGWRDLGTIYAAYALIRQFGVRFYAPGCEHVPELERLVVPVCDFRQTPLLEFRKMTQNLKLGHTPADDLGDPREIGEHGNLVHAAAYLAPFETFSADHPEYFALQKDGDRLHHKEGETRFDVHLCLTNPEVQRLSARRLLALIEKQPERTFFGVSQGDGHAWCQCQACRELDTEPGTVMTDRLLTYVNAAAREVGAVYPDKRILTLAYTTATSPPPVRVLPEPNVMVQFCPYPGRVFCQSHDLTCEKNSGGFDDIKGWIERSPENIYIFDYPRGYKIWYEPFGSFYAMKRKMEFYLANNIRGIYYCGVPTNFQDLFIFVQSRMHWQRNCNVEALIDEFMTAYYGDGAPFIRAYFDFMHREVQARDVHQMCEGANPGLVTPEFAEKALALFERAEAATADDRQARYRVRNEKFCVLFADLNERNPVNGHLAVSEAEFIRRLAEFMELGRQLRRRVIGRREAGVVSDWLYRVCRLRTHTNPWYSDPLCRRMQQDPMKTYETERKALCQRTIENGIELELDAFTRCRGPAEYSYQCEPRRAVWIYGTNTRNPEMIAEFHLDDRPQNQAVLALEAQDDDKPDVVPVEILVNGHSIFRGPNGFAQKGWSSRDFAIAPEVLRSGRNQLTIRTLKPSPASDAGWFMVSAARILTPP